MPKLSLTLKEIDEITAALKFQRDELNYRLLKSGGELKYNDHITHRMERLDYLADVLKEAE